MSQPHEPDHVKLISSLFSPKKESLETATEQLSDRYGPVDWISPELLFDRTQYYAREMGWPLYRRFISFQNLVQAEDIVEIKLDTNIIEEQHLCEGNREINIDPGYISAERLILATGKNYVHRVYLSKGIYADLTLLFKRGSFRALEWTYPDYAGSQVIQYFNNLRAQYLNQLKENRRLD